jgi:hypothetical protein
LRAKIRRLHSGQRREICFYQKMRVIRGGV